MWSQVGHRKNYYEQSYWKWQNSSLATSNPKRWFCLRAALNYVSNFGKLNDSHKTAHGQFSFQSQRRAMPENVQTTIKLCLFHMLARLCLKSFKLVFSSTWTENFQLYKLGFEESEKPEIKLPTFIRSWRKQKISRKNIYFCFSDYAKAFGSVDHSKLKNS